MGLSLSYCDNFFIYIYSYNLHGYLRAPMEAGARQGDGVVVQLRLSADEVDGRVPGESPYAAPPFPRSPACRALSLEARASKPVSIVLPVAAGLGRTRRPNPVAVPKGCHLGSRETVVPPALLPGQGPPRQPGARSSRHQPRRPVYPGGFVLAFRPRVTVTLQKLHEQNHGEVDRENFDPHETGLGMGPMHGFTCGYPYGSAGRSAKLCRQRTATVEHAFCGPQLHVRRRHRVGPGTSPALRVATFRVRHVSQCRAVRHTPRQRRFAIHLRPLHLHCRSHKGATRTFMAPRKGGCAAWRSASSRVCGKGCSAHLILPSSSHALLGLSVTSTPGQLLCRYRQLQL